ncbi:MAG: adenylyl-sulfate kinase [Candidatus Omnitrophica bacterium]|nr:adenylyl-sulfate kinase [Candidatus Omnitrophota bacterium]
MGRVYWITGLSGAGKTTIAEALLKAIREAGQSAVFLDGDQLREVFGRREAYQREDRLDLALQYARLCKMLSEQGLTVICATISLFKEVHAWNREHIPGYTEIFLKVPLDVLRARDSKAIYSQAAEGKLQQVMGVDIPHDEPPSPDLEIVNDGSRSPAEIARIIYELH